MLIYNKIELIPIELEDIKLLNKWKNDEEIFKYLGGGYRPTSISQQKGWFDKIVENSEQNQRYIIVDENNNKVGFIGLYEISSVNRTCSLGIYIGEKKSWGKGIATRAYIALEKYAKEYLNIRKIKLDVVKDNEPAIKLYKKMEYQICGELKEERYIQGKFRDVIMMEKFI